MRLSFPLWLKLGLAFGGLVASIIAVYGLVTFQADLAQEGAERERVLRALAITLAYNVDGAAHSRIRSGADMAGKDYRRVAILLRQARKTHELAWAGTTARDAQGRFYYVVDGGNPPPYPVGYPIFDGNDLRQQVYEGQAVTAAALEDEWGLWAVAMAPVYDPSGKVTGIVEVMNDASILGLYAHQRGRRLVVQVLLAVLAGLAVAVLFSHVLGRDLRRLTQAAKAVASGELDREVTVRSQDEVGALASAFNQMVRGLRERERLRDTFGRYVSRDVASQVLDGGGQAALGGEARTVTVLLSDLRGFTPLTERLGPQETVALLNRYLAAMTEAIAEAGGNLNEILGDGLLVVFGAPVGHDDDPVRAVRCAVAMERALAAFNASTGLRLQMGVGIATGTVVAGNIGGEQRVKYSVVGATVNRASRLESLTLGNQVLVDDATRQAAGDGIEVAEPMEVRVKGMAEPLRCWSVTGIAGDRPAAMPGSGTGERAVLVNLAATAWAIRGKKIDDAPLPVEITMITPEVVLARTAWRPEERDAFLMRVQVAEGEALDGLYTRVASVHPLDPAAGFEVELRITSISEEGRGMLDRALGRG